MIDTASNPRVGVVVTTRNRERLLRDCLTSILAQVVRPHSVLISDDASSDNTQQVVQDFQRSFNVRGMDLWYIRHKKCVGQEVNRRSAMRQCRYPVVGFLDDDDMWEPEFLRDASSALEAQSGASLVATGLTIIDSHGKVDADATVRSDLASGRAALQPGLLDSWLPSHLAGPQFLLGNVLVRRSALEDVDFLPVKCDPICDFALFCSLACRGHRAWWLPDRLFRYRVHSSGRASDRGIDIPHARAEWCYAFAKTLTDRGARRLLMQTSAAARRAVILMYAQRRDIIRSTSEFATLLSQHGVAEVDWRQCAAAILMLAGLRRQLL